MATVISKEEFDAQPSAVVDRAMAGEQIDVEQGGHVRLKLVPVTPEPAKRRRQGGMLKGIISVPQSALDPLSEEELRAWEGE